MNHLVNKKITISGTVQGVGYRYWLKELCDTNNVNGWVLNKKNGEVEAVLINTDAVLFKTILSNCFLGSKKSIVENILVEDFALKKIETSTFEIEK
ncbi:acylphosphatase [Pelagibacteraceae bacterium]|nr:acylphosphatase [Pelagibacteraceae bacterium]